MASSRLLMTSSRTISTRSGASSIPRLPLFAHRLHCLRNWPWGSPPRPAKAGLRKVATEAGSKRFRRATETPFNMIFEVRS